MNIIKKWLLLPIEVKPREYRSRLLIAMEAVNNGCGVIIGRQGNLQANLESYPVGVYFDKSVDGDKLKWYQENLCVRDGMILVSNDEEGLCSDSNEWHYLNQRHSEDVLKILSLFFTWGEREAELLKGHFPNASSKIVVIGNSRVDIWKSDIRTVFEKRVAEIRNRYSPFILMPSSFAAVRYGVGEEFIDREAIRRGVFADSQGRCDYIKRREFMEKSLHLFEELATLIAQRYPKYTIIVRPHPAENLEACRHFAEQVPNIHVVLEGEVTPWILASEAVVHSFCTTGLEAFLMRHPVVSYRGSESHEYANFLSNRVGAIARTPSGALDLLAAILNGHHDQRGSWETGCIELARHIAGLADGEFAYRKTVANLLAIPNWRECAFTPNSSGYMLDLKNRVWQRARKQLRGRQPFIWRDSPYYRQKFNGLTRKELRRDMMALSGPTGLPVPAKVVPINDAVYAMYS